MAKFFLEFRLSGDYNVSATIWSSSDYYFFSSFIEQVYDVSLQRLSVFSLSSVMITYLSSISGPLVVSVLSKPRTFNEKLPLLFDSPLWIWARGDCAVLLGMEGDLGFLKTLGDIELLSDFRDFIGEFCCCIVFYLFSSLDYNATVNLFLINISCLYLIGELPSMRILLVFSFRTAASSFFSVFMVKLESSSLRDPQLDIGEDRLDWTLDVWLEAS